MSVAKIAISVAGGGPWMSFALDAFDTAFSVATGEMSLGDGALSLAKGAASTVASSTISGLGDKLTGAMGSAGFGGIVSTTVSKVATSYANTYATAAINSFSFKGGFHFDKDNFKEMSKGAHLSALKSGAMALTTSIVSESLGGKFEKGKNGWGYSFRDTSALGNKLFYSDKLSRVSRLAGSVSGQLVDLAAGNGFKVNILSTKDLFGLFGSSKDSTGEASGKPSSIQHQGLLELTLGGKKGFELALGGGGLDVSASAIASISDSLKAASFQWKSLGSQKGLADIAYANGQFYAGQSKLANDIVNGSKTISYDITKKGHYGHAGVETDKDIIHLNKEALNYKDASTYGSYIGVMAREGFLIDQNRALMAEGGADSQGIFNRSTARALTLDAFKLQSNVLNNVVNRMGIELRGEHSELKDTVDYVARTGDLSEFETTGRDWKRVNFRDKIKIKDFTSMLKNGKMTEDTLWYSKVSLQKGDKVEDLYGALGIDNASGSLAEMVKKSLIKQLQDKLPFPLDDNIDDATLNKLLGAMDPGDLNVSLNYAKSMGGYSADADLELGRNSEWYEKGLGLIAWPAVQAGKGLAYGANWAWDQLFGGPNYGEKAAYYTKEYTENLPYQKGAGHYGEGNPEALDCSGNVLFVDRKKMGMEGLPKDMNAQMLYDNIPGSFTTRDGLDDGDLIFYKKGNSFEHIVRYLGDGKVMNAWGKFDGSVDRRGYPIGNRVKLLTEINDYYDKKWNSKPYYWSVDWKEYIKKYGGKR